MTAQVVPLKSGKPTPTLAELVDRVRELAKDSDNMGMPHPHLQTRMAQRGVTMRMMLNTIRKGEAVTSPKEDKYGDWRIKFAKLHGRRRVQVVVAVRERSFSVVTVI